MGIPPRRLLGWEPTTITWTDADGLTRSRPEPLWDWVDVAILTAWRQLQETLCPKCGRPVALHEGQTRHDYAVGYNLCPAVEALEAEQAAQHKADEPLRKQGLNPDRARMWHAFLPGEPNPIWDDELPTPD